MFKNLAVGEYHMSYEEAEKALNDLYKDFERGLLLQLLGKPSNEEEFVKEELEAVETEGLLKKTTGEREISVSEEYKKVLALIDALAEFSVELFGKDLREAPGIVYLELKNRISSEFYEFIKTPRFLNVFGKKLKLYINDKSSC
jgi:hypothetical protein